MFSQLAATGPKVGFFAFTFMLVLTFTFLPEIIIELFFLQKSCLTLNRY